MITLWKARVAHDILLGKITMKTLASCSVNNEKIAFFTGGNAPSSQRHTLVFIHGSGGSHENWESQIHSLQNSFTIVALDLPGHGQSEGVGHTDVFAYVDTIDAFLDEVGITKPVLIGHSLGAAISLMFAIRHGEKASAIVPVGGGVTMPVNQLIIDGLKSSPEETIATIAKFSFTRENRDKFSGRLAEAIAKTDTEITQGDFIACNRLDIAAEIGRIGIPTCIVCGAEDKMTPPAMSEFLNSNIRGSQLALIPKAGHFVMMEQPEAFNSVITRFVQSLPAPA